MRMSFLPGVVATVCLVGCSSSTTISTSPSGSKVYVDGQLIGTSPVTYSDTAVSGTTKSVLLKRPGYQDKNVLIRKEEPKVGPIVGGIFFLFPFIWTLGYPESYNFELDR